MKDGLNDLTDELWPTDWRTADNFSVDAAIDEMRKSGDYFPETVCLYLKEMNDARRLFGYKEAVV